MAEIKEVTLKLGVDSSDGQRDLQNFGKQVDIFTKAVERFATSSEQSGKKTREGFSETGKAVITFNQALGIARQGVDSLSRAYAAFVSVVNRGGDVYEVSKAFESISASAGQAANQGLANLTQATQGLISNFDLMKASNAALLAGLSPDQFLTLASAADTLGDAVNQGPKEALETLTTALLTGNERLLKQYGLLIDNKKAEEEFAKSIGRTADRLNEEGKRQAAREAILKKIPEQIQKIGDSGSHAAEGYEALDAALSNAADKFDQQIATNPKLTETFERMAAVIRDLPMEALANGFTLLAAPIQQRIDQLLDFVEAIGDVKRGIDYVLGRGDAAKLASIDSQRSDISAAISAQKQGKNTWKQLLTFNFGKTRSQSTEELESQLAALNEQEKALLNGAKASADFDRTMASLDKTTAGYINSSSGLGVHLQENSDKWVDLNKGAEEAKKKAEQLTEEINKQTQAFKEQGLALEAQVLQKNLEKSIESLDKGAFDSALASYREKLTEATSEKLAAELKDSLASGKITIEEFRNRVSEIVDIESKEFSDKFTEHQKEAFQESVDFFADILTSTITGSAQDLEDIFKNALQRVAIGFGSQLLATAAQSLGLTGLGDIGSAQGLGQALGKLLLGQASFGSLFGENSGGEGSPGFIGPVQPANTNLSFDAISSAFQAAPIQFSIGAIAAPIVAQQSISAIEKILSGKDLKIGEQLALALPTFGASFAYNPVKDFFDSTFGGDSKKAKEREAREALLEQIFGGEATFGTTRGNVTLSDSNFNTPNSPFASQAVGLADPLAQILSGGDDKLASDLAGIFSNATTEAESFNEVFVNTLSLMDKLGLSAEEAKDPLTKLFLEGKISLDEYNAGMANLTLLAANALPGIGDVDGALQVLGETLSEGGAPQIAIKSFELAFAEMAEVGVDTTSEILDYITHKLGPEGAKAFQELFAVGIDSADDFANLTNDQIQAVANIIKNNGDVFAAYVSGANNFGNALDEVEEKARRVQKAVDGIEFPNNAGSRESGNTSPSSGSTSGGGPGYTDSRRNNHRAP